MYISIIIQKAHCRCFWQKTRVLMGTLISQGYTAGFDALSVVKHSFRNHHKKVWTRQNRLCCLCTSSNLGCPTACWWIVVYPPRLTGVRYSPILTGNTIKVLPFQRHLPQLSGCNNLAPLIKVPHVFSPASFSWSHWLLELLVYLTPNLPRHSDDQSYLQTTLC